MGKFIKKTGSNGQYYFSLKAGNGQIILSSEGYASKAARDNGISSVKKNAADDHRYERKTSNNGKHYFNLKANNGQIIGTSQMYNDASACEKGIDAVKSNAPVASVEDE
jgi:uncharacterized protein YegP (UPF0339 family)